MAALPPVPYTIHTNRELGMMLRGEKPLARFAREIRPELPLLERYYRMFDRHVALGEFVKRVVQFDERAPIEHLYYALPGEEWRIQAMEDLLNSPGRWSLEKERREGELLGYADWQNDIWIERYAHTRITDSGSRN